MYDSAPRPNHVDMTNPQARSRRKFLKRTTLGAVALWSSSFLPSSCSRYEEVPGTIMDQLRFFSAHEYLIMKAVAARLVHTIRTAEPDAERISIAIQADRYLADAHPETQRQFHQLLTVFNSPIFAFLFDLRFSSFLDMESADRDSYLHDWMTSRIPFRRSAFQALKRLCMSLYYTDDRTWESIGYGGPFVPT